MALRLQRESDDYQLLVERFEGVADLLSSTLLQELIQLPVFERDDILKLKIEEAVWKCVLCAAVTSCMPHTAVALLQAEKSVVFDVHPGQ